MRLGGAGGTDCEHDKDPRERDLESKKVKERSQVN